jgi:hypothetical protein
MLNRPKEATGKYVPNTKLTPKGCGFDVSLRTTSRFDAKYLRATAYHGKTAVWAPVTGKVTLIKGAR